MICGTFFPCLFFGNSKTFSPVVGVLITMPARKARLGLLNTVMYEQEKYLSSTGEIKELTRSMTGGGGLSNADHLHTLSEEQRNKKEAWDGAYKSRLKFLVRYLKGTNKPLLIRTKSTGVWLSVRGTTISGVVLSVT